MMEIKDGEFRRTFWPSSCSHKYNSQQQNRYRIAANYNTSIFQGDLVAMVTGGGIERVAAGGSGFILGVFNGCEFTDPTTGKPTFSNHYPASTNASDIIANVIDDPNGYL